jgi:hypothetical protein
MHMLRSRPLRDRLALSPFWLVAALVALHLSALLMKHLLGVTDQQPWRFFHHQFNLDRELNIATWVATLLLATAAALLLINAVEQRLTAQRGWRHWGGLGMIFLLLSLDEMCSFHERLSDPIRGALDADGGLFTNAWVLLAAPAVLALLIAYLPFLWRLPAASRWRFIVAAVVFVSGAVGVELFSGAVRDRFGFEDFRFALITTLEELLELVGVALFLRALVLHMAAAEVVPRLVAAAGGGTAGPDAAE